MLHVTLDLGLVYDGLRIESQFRSGIKAKLSFGTAAGHGDEPDPQ
jgi:hypothetical protein